MGERPSDAVRGVVRGREPGGARPDRGDGAVAYVDDRLPRSAPAPPVTSLRVDAGVVTATCANALGRGLVSDAALWSDRRERGRERPLDAGAGLGPVPGREELVTVVDLAPAAFGALGGRCRSRGRRSCCHGAASRERAGSELLAVEVDDVGTQVGARGRVDERVTGATLE